MDFRKYVIVVGDGMADYPIEKLGKRTPLEVADTPNMDLIAGGTIGTFLSIPPDMEAGSDIANMTLLGYDPKLYHTGRAPIEAASMGIDLKEGDVAYRMNLVSLSFEGKRIIMKSHSSGEITKEEGKELVSFLKKNMPFPPDISIYPGIAYRHILIWKNGPYNVETIPPHDLLEKDISSYLSRSDPVVSLIRLSWKYLDGHPVNVRRKKEGLLPANSIWLWGQGKRPSLPSFKERFGIDGAIVCAVDLIRGLGVLVGLEPIYVEGATGYVDTNYRGKAEKALESLERYDLVFIHIEAPDEASHSADIEAKIYAIERIDKDVIGTLLKGLKRFPDYRILIASDHYTPVSKRTHTKEPSPFAWAKKDQIEKGIRRKFCEKEASSGPFFEKGYELISSFLYC